MTNLRPGWYVAYDPAGRTCCFERLEHGWRGFIGDIPRQWYIYCRVDAILRAVAGPIGTGWEPIFTAPRDGGPVWVYAAMAHGLSPFEGRCSWHPDAGWCADELRPVTHWHPETTKMLRDAERYRLLKKRLGDQLDEDELDAEIAR